MTLEELKKELIKIDKGIEGDNFTRENIHNYLKILNGNVDSVNKITTSTVLDELKEIMDGIETDRFTTKNFLTLISKIKTEGIIAQRDSTTNTKKVSNLIENLENEMKILGAIQILFSDKVKKGLNNVSDYSNDDYVMKFIYRHQNFSISVVNSTDGNYFRMFHLNGKSNRKNPMVYLDVSNILESDAVDILEEANYLYDKTSDL